MYAVSSVVNKTLLHLTTTWQPGAAWSSTTSSDSLTNLHRLNHKKIKNPDFAKP